MLMPESMLKDEFKDPWACITLFDCKSVQGLILKTHSVPSIDMASKAAADLVDILGSEHGVSLQYKSTLVDKNYIWDALNGIVQIGLSMIPMIGPLVVLGESFLYEYIKDPDGFVDSWSTEKGLVSKLPGFGAAMTGSAVNCRGFMKEIGGKGSTLAGAKPSMAKLPVEEGEKKKVFIGTGK